jgi:universal stress protein E
MPLAATPIGPSIEVEEAHSQLQASELKRLASPAGVPASAQHLRVGVVAGELCDTAKKTKAAIVVMGAVSRSALGRIFIGSTAEDVLDELTSDVLVLKPKAFQSKVAAREYTYSFASRA